MNPQLQVFYSQSSPTKALDHKLIPIFSLIRTRNINCVSQLQNEPKRQTTFAGPNRHIPQFLLGGKQKKRAISYLKSGNRSMKVTKGIPHKLQSLPNKTMFDINRQKVIMVNPNSKIKKHLVSSIDYNGIEEALFRKTERITRFDQFCRTLKEHKKWIESERIADISEDQFKNCTIDGLLNDQKRQFKISKKEHSPMRRMMEHVIRTQPLSRQSNF